MKTLYKVRNTANKLFISEFHPFYINEKYRVRYSKEGGRTWKTQGGAQRFILAVHYKYPKQATFIKALEHDGEFFFWLKNLSYNLEVVECTIEEKSVYNLDSIMSGWEGQWYKQMYEEMEGK